MYGSGFWYFYFESFVCQLDDQRAKHPFWPWTGFVHLVFSTLVDSIRLWVRELEYGLAYRALPMLLTIIASSWLYSHRA